MAPLRGRYDRLHEDRYNRLAQRMSNEGVLACEKAIREGCWVVVKGRDRGKV
jgi:hypothetical protein